MHLKYLELSGFKSFPKRTRIEFPKGICAIVGPNGCGKSNIVDAIRWVLGEQSPSVLRARSMEELLYSGNKKSCNLAWVRLLIEEKDPENSMLPPELTHLSEIEIERQLWRSGESKYLLNRKICRLKDIEYLFLDTGASRKSFAIIDQGKIGSIIESGASQYKILIEEIAGISRYRARRSQTQQKLFETSQNIKRLKDVIREVESQAHELKRQVKRCEEFLSLKREYNNIQLAIFWLRYKEQKDNLLSLYKKADELKQLSDSLKEQKESLYKELTSLDVKISNISDKLNSTRNQYLELQNITSQKEIEINKLKSKYNILKSKINELNSEIYRNQKKQKFLIKQLAELDKKKEKFIIERDDISLKLDKTNVEINNISISKIEKLDNEIETLKNQLIEVESYIAKYSRENEFISQQIKQLEIKKLKLLDNINNLLVKLENFTHKKQTIEVEIKKLTQILNENTERLSKLDKNLSKLKELLSRYNSQKQEITLLYQDIEYKLKQLNNEIINKDDLLLGTKFLLNNFNNIGIVADFIDVDRGVEAFLELSLGRLLEAVIFTDIDELYKALDALKKENYPDCNIIFIKEFDKNLSNFLEKYIYLDNKKKKILYHPQLRELLEQKIDIKIISNKLDLKDIKNHGFCNPIYITQNKHIIVTNHFIINIVGNYRDGLLTKRNLINVLLNQKINYKTKLDKLKSKITRIQNIINKKQKTFFNLKINISNIEKEISEKRNILELATSQIEILKNKIEAINFEIDEIDIQLNTFIEEKDKIKISVKNKETIKTQLYKNLEIKQKELANLKTKYSQLQKYASKLEIQIARLDENIKSVTNETNNTNLVYKNSIKKLKEIELKRENFNIELNKLKNKINLEENDLNNLKKQINNYLKEIANLEEKLKDNKKLFDFIDKKFKGKQLQLSNIEKQLNTTEIDISKLNFKTNELLTITKQQLRIDLKHITEIDSKYSNKNIENLNKKLIELNSKIENFGPINLEAAKQYKEVNNRLTSLYKQYKDLEISISNLKKAIIEIDNTCKKALLTTLYQINEQLSKIFPILFEGACAKLKILDDFDILNAQFELSIKIPGKRIKHMGLLSGGEKALASIAFVFSLYLTKASPFCILDEIDAPLDQVNINKLNKLLELLSKKTQIILITHNQSVMEIADVIYGVTMEESGISKVICLPLKDLFKKEAQYA